MDNSIGSRIKAAREESRLSQFELAQKVGFQSATAISLIESGERGVSSEILLKLGNALHRSVGYFLGYDSDPAMDVQVALRADKDIRPEDKEAISRFIEFAKSRNNGK